MLLLFFTWKLADNGRCGYDSGQFCVWDGLHCDWSNPPVHRFDSFLLHLLAGQLTASYMAAQASKAVQGFPCLTAIFLPRWYPCGWIWWGWQMGKSHSSSTRFLAGVSNSRLVQEEEVAEWVAAVTVLNYSPFFHLYSQRWPRSVSSDGSSHHSERTLRCRMGIQSALWQCRRLVSCQLNIPLIPFMKAFGYLLSGLVGTCCTHVCCVLLLILSLQM